MNAIKSPVQVLNSPIIEAAGITEYQAFMRSPNQGFNHMARLSAANEEIQNTFPLKENVRSRWNTVMLWKPGFCGKKHENRRNGFTAYQCEKRNNVCCGHPEINGMIHTLGLGSWICTLLGRQLDHPMGILNGLMEVDLDAGLWYGSTDFSNPTRTPEEIEDAERKILEIEKKIFFERIKPYMGEVSKILTRI